MRLLKKKLQLNNKLLKKVLISMLVLIVIIPVLFFFSKNGEKVSANWWDEDWQYRKAIPVTNNTTTETNVYIILSNYDASDTSKYQADCGDIRFTKENGEPLPYYLIGCGATTTIHVNFNTLPAGTQTIFIYYGNPTTENGSEETDFSTVATNYTIGTIASEEVTPGTTAYWSLNEGQGGTAHDSNQNNIDGSITGATWKTEDMCISGKCLYFDGTGDYVTSTDTRLNTISSGGSVTYAIWFRTGDTDTATTYPNIIGIRSAVSPYDIFNIRISSGILQAEIYENNQNSSINTNINVIDNLWHHVALVKSGNTAILYLDGNQKGTATNTWGEISNTNFIVGSRYTTTGYYEGFIDEIKIYPYARSANNIKNDYIRGANGSDSGVVFGATYTNYLNNGLVGYWKMEETATPSIDFSGNSNNGTWNGDTTFTTGKYGNSLSFDGTGDYVSIGDPASGVLDFDTNDFTVSAWIKNSQTLTGDDNIYGITNKYSSNSAAGWSFCLRGGVYKGLLLRIGASDGLQDITPTNSQNTLLSNGSWHFVAATRKNGVVSLFIDGSLVGSATGNKSTSNSSNQIIANYDQAGNYSFNGLLDEIRIYNKNLSPTEIQQLYNFAPSPYVYWKFDENTGNTVNDNSGNNISGTLNGTGNHWNEGKKGKSGSFGGNTPADVMTTTALNGTTFPLQGTISFWFKINNNATWNNWNGIVSTVDNRGDTPPNWFNIDKVGTNPAASQIYVYFTNSSAQQTNVITTSNFGAENGWTYFTVTWDQSTSNVKIYANSKLDKSQDSVTTWPSIFPTFQLAKDRNFSNRYFDGLIDDFKIYNYARTPAQIVEDMNGGQFNGNSAIGYWKLNEGYGDASYNSGFGTSMNGNLGGSGQACPTSGTVPCPTWTNSGKFGKALTFDGTDDFVDLGTGINSSSITLSTWVNFGAPTGAGSGHTFIDKGYQTGAGEVYWLYADAGNDLHFSFGNGTSYEDVEADTGNSMSRNVWNHVVATFDTGKVKLYINGKIVKDTTSTITALQIGQTSWQTQLGKYWTATNNWLLNGSLDEVQIYNFALTQNQINLIYNQNQSTILGAASTSSDYLAYDSFSGADGSLGSTQSTDPDGRPLTPLTWTGATWSVSANKVINTPNLGTEAETDPGLEGTYTTGLNDTLFKQYTPVLAESADSHGGTKAQQYYGLGTNYALYQTQNKVTLTANQWYTFSLWGKRITNNSSPVSVLSLSLGFTPGSSTQMTLASSDYVQRSRSSRLNNASSFKIDWIYSSGNPSDEIVLDDLSIKPLTLSELFSTVNTDTNNTIASVNLTRAATVTAHPFGLVTRLDSTSNPQNFLLAYMYTGPNEVWHYIILEKVVNGTYTTLISDHSATYVAGAPLKVIVEGTSVSLYYNGKQIGATQTVTDTSIINNTIHGLFSTYSGNTLDNFSLQSLPTSHEYCPPGDTISCPSPVAEWKMDEKTGTTNYDTSGNNHPANFSGSPSPIWNSICPIGSCINVAMDNIADYTGFADADDSLDFTVSDDFSFSYWIKSTNPAPENAMPLHKGGLVSSNEGYGTRLSAGNFECSYSDGTAQDLASLGTNINDGIWRHITCVMDRDGSEVGVPGLHLFINGELKVSDTTISTVNAGATFNEPLRIGNMDTNREWEGSIDQVRIFDYAQTPSQINWDYSQGKAIAKYNFDECEGNTLHDTALKADRSSSGYDGTISAGDSSGDNDSVGTCSSGAVNPTNEMWNAGTTGKYNGALDFDGTNDWVSLGNNAFGNMGDSHSISVWIKTAEDGTILSEYEGGVCGDLIFSVVSNVIRFHNGGAGTLSGNKVVNDGNWHHIVAVSDISNVYIYVDGKLDNSGSDVNWNNGCVNQDVRIGARDTTGGEIPFDGLIDDLQIYKYSLNQDQVKNIYNENSALKFE